MKNPYLMLGIPESASISDIKSAFRKHAKGCHPDHNPGDKAKEDRFKDLVDAYDLLRDEKRRKVFDAGLRKTRAAETRKPAAAPAQQPHEQIAAAIREMQAAQARRRAAQERATRESLERLRRRRVTDQKPGAAHIARALNTANSSPLGSILGLAALVGIAAMADAREKRRGKWDHRVQRRRGPDGRIRPTP